MNLNLSERCKGRMVKGKEGECWEWKGARSTAGYGILTVTYLAHRLAFEFANGRQPSGVIRHSCDNPACCNPAHLIDGTAAENVNDRVMRGRGTRSGKSINPWRACGVMARLLMDVPRPEVSGEFGMSKSQVGCIWNGNTWRSLFAEGST